MSFVFFVFGRTRHCLRSVLPSKLPIPVNIQDDIDGLETNWGKTYDLYVDHIYGSVAIFTLYQPVYTSCTMGTVTKKQSNEREREREREVMGKWNTFSDPTLVLSIAPCRRRRPWFIWCLLQGSVTQSRIGLFI